MILQHWATFPGKVSSLISNCNQCEPLCSHPRCLMGINNVSDLNLKTWRVWVKNPTGPVIQQKPAAETWAEHQICCSAPSQQQPETSEADLQLHEALTADQTPWAEVCPAVWFYSPSSSWWSSDDLSLALHASHSHTREKNLFFFFYPGSTEEEANKGWNHQLADVTQTISQKRNNKTWTGFTTSRLNSRWFPQLTHSHSLV